MATKELNIFLQEVSEFSHSQVSFLQKWELKSISQLQVGLIYSYQITSTSRYHDYQPEKKEKPIKIYMNIP